MGLRKRFLVIFLSVLGIIGEGFCLCRFEGLLASCRMIVDGFPIQISARVNHCHAPMDITFLIKTPRFYGKNLHREEPLYWEYTYVTTNQPETQEIVGYDRRILFHMFAQANIDEKSGRVNELEVRGRFSVDGASDESLLFVEESVSIPRTEDCLFLERDNHITKIAIGMSVTVILFFATGITLFIINKNKNWVRRLSEEDRRDLIPNMEPSSTRRKRRAHHSRRGGGSPEEPVKYVVPVENDEQHELTVYVSTSNGLQKVKRQHSQSSRSSQESSSSAKQSSNPVQKSDVSLALNVPTANEGASLHI